MTGEEPRDASAANRHIHAHRRLLHIGVLDGAALFDVARDTLLELVRILFAQLRVSGIHYDLLVEVDVGIAVGVICAVHDDPRALAVTECVLDGELAGQRGATGQRAIEHTLGEGKGAKIVVDGTYDPENDAYTGFEEQVVIDASDAGLSEEDADKLKERVTRHIDKGCTVKHTYVQETPVRMNVTVKH